MLKSYLFKTLCKDDSHSSVNCKYNCDFHNKTQMNAQVTCISKIIFKFKFKDVGTTYFTKLVYDMSVLPSYRAYENVKIWTDACTDEWRI